MSGKNLKSRDSAKEKDIRLGNIIAAKAVADAVRTSLGPRGMDKMIQSDTGEVIITNDGATILERMQVFHPTAKMLVGISKSQDIEAGDGTTSVVVIAGAFLEAVLKLLEKGVHPTIIADCFVKAEQKSREILRSIAIPVNLDDRDSLIQAATISLSSKIVYQNADILAPMAVDAVLKVADRTNNNVDLEDVRVVERLGGTVDDSEMIDGCVVYACCFLLHCCYSFALHFVWNGVGALSRTHAGVRVRAISCVGLLPPALDAS